MHTLTRIILICCALALGLSGATRVLAAVAVDDAYFFDGMSPVLDEEGIYYYPLLPPQANDTVTAIANASVSISQPSVGGSITELTSNNASEFRYYPGTFIGTAIFNYTLFDSGDSSTDNGVIIIQVGAGSPEFDDACGQDQTTTSFCTELNTIQRSQQLSTIAAQTDVLKGLQSRQANHLRGRFSELRQGANPASVSGLNAQIYGEYLALGQWSQSYLNEMTGGGASDSLGAMNPFGFFVTGTLSVGERDGDVSTVGYDSDGYNLTFGLDYRLSDALVWGAALGLAKDEIEFSSNLGEQATDMVSLATFVNYYLSEKVYLDALMIYGQGDLDTTRNILGETARGTTDSDVWSFAVSAGYDATNGAWQYGAFSRLEYSKANVDGYSETGSSYDLSVSSHGSKSAELALGGRIGHAFSLASCVLVPSLDVEWVNQFESDGRLIGVGVEDISSTFGAYDEGFDKSYANAGLSVSAVFEAGLSMFLRAESNFADDQMALKTYSGGVRWEF